MAVKTTALGALLVLSWSTWGAAQAPETIRIPMPDSVQLLADLYRAPSAARAPTLLVRTPYQRQAWRSLAPLYAARGYHVVIQDVRGRNGSGGRFVPFLHEKADGLATLTWIGAQPWSNGAAGMMGASYSSFAGLTAAAAGHPALKAVINNSGWAQPESLMLPGGAQHLMLNLPWTLFSLGGIREGMNWDSVFRQVPLSNAITLNGGPHPAWAGFLSRYPAFDPALAASGMGSGSVRVPVLHITGWWDFTYRGTLDAYDRISKFGSSAARKEQRLIIGPWYHDQQKTTQTTVGAEAYGAAAALGWDRLNAVVLDWFARYLPSDVAASSHEVPAQLLSDKPVTVFVMGANRWQSFDSWPPRQTRRRTYYLASSGELRDDVAREGARTFTYDPLQPMPTRGGANFHFFPQNIGPLESVEQPRADVLAYTSAALRAPTTLLGPLSVILHVATDAVDTDFTAKLSVLDAQGVSRIVEDGIVRLRFRHGLRSPTLVEPGAITEITIPLGATARELKAGDRLRLEVSSSNFPKYDRNPNDGTNPLTATTFRPARQTVYHGARLRSRLVLTTLE